MKAEIRRIDLNYVQERTTILWRQIFHEFFDEPKKFCTMFTKLLLHLWSTLESRFCIRHLIFARTSENYVLVIIRFTKPLYHFNSRIDDHGVVEVQEP